MDIVNPIVRNRMRAGLEDSDAFWDSAARKLPWLKTWDTVYEADYPSFRWFVGGQTNLSYMCVDHQTASGRGGHAAFIYASERGVRQVLTYAQLQRQVERAAAALRGMGLRKGDRLTIYMPNALETVVLMLATVRIGAIHSIVFAGFSAPALADRISASGSRLVFSADVAYRRGGEVNLKSIVDDALALGCDTVEHQVVLLRNEDVPMTERARLLLGRVHRAW